MGDRRPAWSDPSEQRRSPSGTQRSRDQHPSGRGRCEPTGAAVARRPGSSSARPREGLERAMRAQDHRKQRPPGLPGRGGSGSSARAWHRTRETRAHPQGGGRQHQSRAMARAHTSSNRRRSGRPASAQKCGARVRLTCEHQTTKGRSTRQPPSRRSPPYSMNYPAFRVTAKPLHMISPSFGWCLQTESGRCSFPLHAL